MNTSWQGARQTAWALMRARGFTIVAVLTLAIGTGAVATIYNVIDTVAIRPLPFVHAERLVVLNDTYTPSRPGSQKVALDVIDWQAMRGTFRGLAAVFTGGVNLSESQGARRITATQTMPGLFAMLGGSPLLGRSFVARDGTPGQGPVAIVSEGLWKERFGAAADILGHVIMLNGRPFTVVGVMPATATFPGGTDVWLPFVIPHNWGSDIVHGHMTVLARLANGVSVQHAQAAVNHAERAFATAHPPPFELNHVTLTPLRAHLVGDARTKDAVLIGAAALMLLLACANVAGLLLARAEMRQHEVAVRAALGATRGRLLRQLLGEGAMLAVGGTAAGMGLAWGLQPVCVALVPAGIAGLVSTGIERQVFLGTMLASVVTTLLFCLAPAIMLARTEVHTVLKASGPRGASKTGTLWQRLLVAQIGVTVVILVAAGLLLKSFWRLQHVDAGFDRDHVLTVSVALPRTTYATAAQVSTYYRNGVARLLQIPGVTAVGVVNSLPLTGRASDYAYSVVGQPPPAVRPMAEHLVASPGYFRALRIPVLAGRTFTEADLTSRSPVIVVDERLARRLGSVRRAVGMRLRLPWDSTYQIIGVVHTVRDGALDGSNAPPGQFYFPMTVNASRGMTFVVRGASDDAHFVGVIRKTIGMIDPSVPPYAIHTMAHVVASSIAPQRTVTGLLVIGGVFGLLLAVVGIYGVVAASVVRRTREMGIRMALGATGSRIGAQVLRQALLVSVWGIGFGLVGAWISTQALAHVLYDVPLADVGVYLAAAACVGVAAMAATLLPVWRATTIDPIIALRNE